MRTIEHWIGGKSVAGESPRYGEVFDPAVGAPQAQVVLGTPDDVDAAVERAVTAGAKLESAAKDTPYGRIAMLADPFGHGLCLLEWKGRGYDEIADRG